MVYERLLAGENVVLSAPTSFGKSLVIDAILAARDFDNVAIIVPTLALMDETRRRLSHLSDRYKVITHGTQERSARNLWVMTQERMLDMGVPEGLDFFVIDEFYKLDPSHSDDRSNQLNILLWQLLATNAQFYMLGPNITAFGADTANRIRASFISTGYSTVATDIERIHSSKEQLPDDLAAVCRDVGPGTLIFCSSPARPRSRPMAHGSKRWWGKKPDVRGRLDREDVPSGLDRRPSSSARNRYSPWSASSGTRSSLCSIIR